MWKILPEPNELGLGSLAQTCAVSHFSLSFGFGSAQQAQMVG